MAAATAATVAQRPALFRPPVSAACPVSL